MTFDKLPTPSYVIDEAKLKQNLEILHRVEEEAGCKILLAQKAFSAYATYPLIGSYISGCTASGLYEARLGAEEMKKENHVFSPAYRPDQVEEIAGLCDHMIFNSFSQVEKFGTLAKRANPKLSMGLRLNPQHSTQDHAIYDPCARGSRLGVTFEKFKEGLEADSHALDRIEGFHMHTLCEQDSDALEETVEAMEQQFGPWLHKTKWLNLGGGHHITREGYDIPRLIKLIRRLKETYGVEVYLEPGEAVALNAGYLVTQVLEQVDNGMKILLLDASAACHMPDVLEMPYRPPLADSGEPGEKPYTYRLSSCTCLAGDVIGDYSFDRKIQVGDRLIFQDMAIYSMVKNNTFNGIGLPSIYLQHQDGDCSLIREFGYQDFKGRL